jgi:hypothetical protein
VSWRRYTNNAALANAGTKTASVKMQFQPTFQVNILETFARQAELENVSTRRHLQTRHFVVETSQNVDAPFARKLKRKLL